MVKKLNDLFFLLLYNHVIVIHNAPVTLTENAVLGVYIVMVMIFCCHRGRKKESFVYIEESFFARILSCSNRIPLA